MGGGFTKGSCETGDSIQTINILFRSSLVRDAWDILVKVDCAVPAEYCLAHRTGPPQNYNRTLPRG